MRYATIHCILPQGNVSGWECLPNSIYVSLNRAGDKVLVEKTWVLESKEGNKHGTVLTSYVAFANLLLLQATAGFSYSSAGKRICLQGRRPGFDSWVAKVSWRRKWQPTPVFLPRESHGQRTLAGYSLWDCKSQTQLSD